MTKNLQFGTYQVQLTAPQNINFNGNSEDQELYTEIYTRAQNIYSPIINADDIVEGHLNVALPTLSASVAALNQKESQEHIRLIIGRHPVLLGLIHNTLIKSEISISNAEFIIASRTNQHNFIEVKRVIDEINRNTWNRQQHQHERQSGVSNLGSISEKLLETAFSGIASANNVIKVNSQKVESYGDFVVMCLPNNLWISVKSNFARERLLASGYSNDIIGAGFFQEAREFTSQHKIRNFQKAGFLAMYCPDVAVTPAQVLSNSSTYHEIMDHYQAAQPLNINGSPFIRPLSQLAQDLNNFIARGAPHARFSVDF